MKVLFAVNNESISESIIKKYQQEYKEIISVKNVYYFNAIIKELQRDKTYDRIVISEDLQPYSNNDYNSIDKFIFEKMDNISDEATNQAGGDIPIILICTDRRTKSEPLLVKLFGIGVYNALLGKDRSITNVCDLLARPRTKKEAKVYYHIDSEDVDYKVENEGDVTEVEIQNIINHYKKLGGNEEKYVESFDHIASQYTDSQLRLIAKFLPLNVKAVLEANSSKYQEVVSFGETTSNKKIKLEKPEPKSNQYVKTIKPKETTPDLDIIKNNLSKNRITEPVIIPSAIDKNKMKRENMKQNSLEQANKNKETPVKVQEIQEIDDILNDLSENNQTVVEAEDVVEPTYTNASNNSEGEVIEPQAEVKRGRGRPRKAKPEGIQTVPVVKRGRGRPKKSSPEVAEPNEQTSILETINPVEQVKENNTPVNLFELGEEEQENTSNSSSQSNDFVLPGLDDEPIIDEQPLEVQNNVNTIPERNTATNFNAQQNNSTPNQNSIQNTANSMNSQSISSLLTREKKVVAFVGTSKNGTSFLVNNVAEMLSQKGINTAILDLTKNRNAYYIYTENEENLRKVAYSCIENLRSGRPEGIQVHKNLTVYTTLPDEEQNINDYSNILQTLVKNYSLVILDCDFETNIEYFSEAQELYLVQSFDILTIQPLTAFMRNLKAKNVLNPEKLRLVLNKAVRLRSVSEKTIIGGMAYYNDPSMSFMTELFNKDTAVYCTIPFEEQTYSKYLDGLVNCKISLNGYSKIFMSSLSKLADMVYPLINNNMKNKGNNNYNNYNSFPNSMNSTLDKMKNNY